MKRLLIILGLALLICSPAFSITLKEMYDQAPAAHGYDKYIELQTGVVYTGGLYLGKTFNRITAEFVGDVEVDVMIKGNGAILDLEGGEICISYCTNRLDINNCVILNGNIRYRGMSDNPIYLKPGGTVRYVTFYRCDDYGVRIFGCGDDVLIERCIMMDTVDTGPDFMYINGMQNDWLPTGACIAFSGLGYGTPTLKDNWTYFTDPAVNSDGLRHYVKLCEYG